MRKLKFTFVKVSNKYYIRYRFHAYSLNCPKNSLIYCTNFLDDGEPDIEQQPEDDDSKGESKRKITPNGLENGIKGAIKEKTSEDIEKERKKKLMMLGCEAFMFTIRKRNRLQDPKNPRHRWFRWKDR